MAAMMPLDLYIEWMAYARLNPFGEERKDMRAAMVSMTMANIWRGKNRRAFKLTDFMPKFGRGRPTRAKSAREIYQALKDTLFLRGGLIDKRERDA